MPRYPTLSDQDPDVVDLSSKPMDLSNIITIKLPKTGDVLYVHEDVLCEKSAYAKGCLHGAFIEATDNNINLTEEEDADSIKTIMSWMYRGNGVLHKMPDGRDVTHAERDNFVIKMSKLYVMADRLMVNELKDFLINRWDVWILMGGNHLEAVRVLYREGPSDCLLRQRLVRFFANEAGYFRARGESGALASRNPSLWVQDFRAVCRQCSEFGSQVFLQYLEADPYVVTPRQSIPPRPSEVTNAGNEDSMEEDGDEDSDDNGGDGTDEDGDDNDGGDQAGGEE